MGVSFESCTEYSLRSSPISTVTGRVVGCCLMESTERLWRQRDEHPCPRLRAWRVCLTSHREFRILLTHARLFCVQLC